MLADTRARLPASAPSMATMMSREAMPSRSWLTSRRCVAVGVCGRKAERSAVKRARETITAAANTRAATPTCRRGHVRRCNPGRTAPRELGRAMPVPSFRHFGADRQDRAVAVGLLDLHLVNGGLRAVDVDLPEGVGELLIQRPQDERPAVEGSGEAQPEYTFERRTIARERGANAFDERHDLRILP